MWGIRNYSGGGIVYFVHYCKVVMQCLCLWNPMHFYQGIYYLSIGILGQVKIKIHVTITWFLDTSQLGGPELKLSFIDNYEGRGQKSGDWRYPLGWWKMVELAWGGLHCIIFINIMLSQYNSISKLHFHDAEHVAYRPIIFTYAQHNAGHFPVKNSIPWRYTPPTWTNQRRVFRAIPAWRVYRG